MRIKEVCKITGLTDKAIRFYINNQLINPSFSENYAGRKNYSFSEQDIDDLKKIAVLRIYNFSISDIKDIFVNNENINLVLENHLNNTRQDLAQTSHVIANLDNALDSSVNTVDELCLVLSKNLEPDDYNFEKKKKSIWKRIKKKLPKFILITLGAIIVAVLVVIFIIFLLTNLFMNLS